MKQVNEAWLTRLIEIRDKVATSQGQERDGWINHLLGYIESAKEDVISKEQEK